MWRSASSRPERSDPPAAKRVVVVGAGLAGLAAARTLESRGVSTTVLEAETSPGGRFGPVGGPDGPADVSLVTVPRATPALDRLARDCGMGTLGWYGVDRVGIASRRGTRVLELPRAGRRGSVPGLSLLERLRARRVRNLVASFGAIHEHAAESVRLDDRSVDEFCALYLGRRLLDLVYTPLLEGHFGLRTARTSRVVLLDLLGEQGGPTVKLGRLGPLLERLASGLPDVRESQRVSSIRPGEVRVDLASGARVAADAVVVAVPPEEARKIVDGLSPPEEAFLESCGHTRRRAVLLPSPHGGERPPEVVWLPRSLGGPLAAVIRLPSGALLLVARPEDPEQQSASASSLLAAARRLDPSLATREESAALVEVPRLAPLVPVGRIGGQVRFTQGRARRLQESRVEFCGGYLAAPHAEGMARSGIQAAERVLGVLGLGPIRI